MFIVIAASQQDAPHLKLSGLHGYINASVQEAPEEFRYGVSLYSAAWSGTRAAFGRPHCLASTSTSVPSSLRPRQAASS